MADANVLLSAVLGGAARRALAGQVALDVATTRFTMDEVAEYVPVLAREKRLPEWELLAALASLPIRVYERAEYAFKVGEAARRIAKRDPDDVDLLALALWLGAEVWSNDRDFEGTGVKLCTTAQLLRRLERR